MVSAVMKVLAVLAVPVVAVAVAVAVVTPPANSNPLRFVIHETGNLLVAGFF